MILDEIIANKKIEVAALKKKFKLPLAGKLRKAMRARDLVKAISGKKIALIAEVKASSPSAGTMIKGYDPVKLAKIYVKAGASAISVLTDKKFFRGSIEDLKKVKKAVKVPVLRKDFIIDELQIYESMLAGADAVLLIARILSHEKLESFIKIADDLGMAALVEVHSISEARTALDAGARLIGINNRDLNTLAVDLGNTVNIINSIPELKAKTLVSESGISQRPQVELLEDLGVNAVLVGEAILKSYDIPAKIKELVG